MNRDDILRASRNENKNRDLPELEATARAGSIAGRIGASVCVLLSLLAIVLADTYLYSPWIIYFAILGSNWLVRFLHLRKRTDLAAALLFLGAAVAATVGFVLRLVEVGA